MNVPLVLDAASLDSLLLLVVQVTAVAAAGLLAAAQFRRAAASRHAVLCASLVALAACPVATWLCSLAGWTMFEITIPAVHLSPDHALPAGSTFRAGSDERSSNSDRLANQAGAPIATRETGDRSNATDPWASELERNSSDQAELAGLADRAKSPAPAAPPSFAQSATRVAVGVWAIGFLLMLLRIAHGWFLSCRICREAIPLAGQAFRPLLSQIEGLFVRRRQPRVLMSDRIGTAVAVGLLRPAIVLPRTYVDELSIDDLRLVLSHEAAHLLRRDLAVVWVQRLVAALYWPHPVVHLLSRRLSRAREEVCDNYVLQQQEPVNYAELLLRLVQSSQQKGLPSEALAFLSSGWKLEERVAGLLDRGRSRSTIAPRRFLILAATVIGAIAVLLGGLRLVAREGTAAVAEEKETTVAPSKTTVAIEKLPEGALFRLGSGRFRHEGWDKQVGFARGGAVLVSSSGRSLKFWDAKTGSLLREASLAGTIHRAMKITPDGMRVATLGGKTGSKSGEPLSWVLRLWDVDTAVKVAEISHRMTALGEIRTFALSSDGTLAFLGDSSGNVSIIELVTGGQMLQYKLADLQPIHRIALSPDGRHAAVTTGSDELLLWSWTDGGEPVVLHSGRRHMGVAFSPDGRLLAVGCDGKTDVQIWDVPSRSLVRTVEDDPQSHLYVEELAFTPDGTKLAAANAIRLILRPVSAVLVWDVLSGKLLKRFTAQGMDPRALSISPDGRALAAVDWDAGLQVWDINSGESLGSTGGGHRGLIRGMTYSDASQHLLTASDDSTARIWNVRSGHEIGRLDHDAGVMAIAQSADGRLVATADIHDKVTLWEAASRRKLHTFNGGRGLGGAWYLAFSPDGIELLAIQDDLHVRAWRTSDGAQIRDVELRPSGMRLANDGQRSERERLMELIPSHALTEDGSKLVLMGNNRSWWAFDLKSGKEISRHSLKLTLWPNFVAVSSDSRMIAVAGFVRQDPDPNSTTSIAVITAALAVLDFKTGGILWEAKRNDSHFASLRFSPANNLLAVGIGPPDKPGIELYDVVTGRLRHRFDGGEPIGRSDYGLAFSRDGKQLASVQADSTVLVWDLEKLKGD